MTELYSADELESLTIQPELLPPDVAKFFEPALCGTCYVCHLVECFRYVRRVLRDDGVLWLNLGDSYAGSGRGTPGRNAIGNQIARQGFNGDTDPHGLRKNKTDAPPGYKAKDLLMMPFRVAMALQADGWWLRSVIPWLKRNSMPESVSDRPSTSVEYVFLLAKSAHYFWNADAVRADASGNTHSRGSGDGGPKMRAKASELHMHEGWGASTREVLSSRNRRNSDWFFESWQGLMMDETDDPLALVVNPTGFKQAHFATFPAKLVEPMVKASTRPGDTVLDPFGGAGTVGLVADRLGRNAILCELSDQYGPMATNRIRADAPMFSEVAAD